MSRGGNGSEQIAKPNGHFLYVCLPEMSSVTVQAFKLRPARSDDEVLWFANTHTR